MPTTASSQQVPRNTCVDWAASAFPKKCCGNDVELTAQASICTVTFRIRLNNIGPLTHVRYGLGLSAKAIEA